MGIMKTIFLSPLILLFFIFPLNAEMNEKKDYGKYDFYAKCLDDALTKTLNTGLVYECSLEANEKIAALIQDKISSKGDCDKEGFESHACTLERSQKAFKNYYQSECNWNKYGTMYVYCEMMLKKDRLIWLDETLGN